MSSKEPKTQRMAQIPCLYPATLDFSHGHGRNQAYYNGKPEVPQWRMAIRIPESSSKHPKGLLNQPREFRNRRHPRSERLASNPATLDYRRPGYTFKEISSEVFESSSRDAKSLVNSSQQYIRSMEAIQGPQSESLHCHQWRNEYSYPRIIFQTS